MTRRLLFYKLQHRGVGVSGTPFPGLLQFTFDLYLMVSVKQGGTKYYFLSLWFDLGWTASLDDHWRTLYLLDQYKSCLRNFKSYPEKDTNIFVVTHKARKTKSDFSSFINNSLFPQQKLSAMLFFLGEASKVKKILRVYIYIYIWK